MAIWAAFNSDNLWCHWAPGGDSTTTAANSNLVGDNGTSHASHNRMGNVLIDNNCHLLIPVKVVNDHQDCYYKNITVESKALDTLNKWWWIHQDIIDAFVAMLDDLVNKKLRTLLPTTCPRVIMFPTHCEVLQGSIINLFIDISSSEITGGFLL